MGAFKDLLDALKGSVSGPFPFGGTAFPTSEGFPTMVAHSVKGAFFSLENLDQLADIPYENLVLNQEVVVGQFELPDTTLHSVTRYRLVNMPALNTKVSDVPDFVVTDYWQIVIENVESEEPGPAGNNGWSPVFANEPDGPNRTVQKLIGWIGGQGSSPAIPADSYIGASGYVVKSAATNIQGQQGPAGNALLVRPEAYFSVGTRAIVAPDTVFNFALGSMQNLPSNQSLTVTNTWSQPRSFIIRGQAHFADTNGECSWVAQLVEGDDGNRSAQTTDVLRDENYARGHYVNVNTHPSILKILVGFKTVIPAGQSKKFRMKLGQSAGPNNSKYSYPFIEAWGL
ncbi:MAG: hypothetical protein WKF87_06800 [Chryseolinea sp.]